MEGQSKTPKILIVEDNPETNHLYTAVLNKKGYDVKTTLSSTKAIQIINVENFAVVLLDYHLQDINGMELLKRVKKRFPHSQVIMMSGSPDYTNAVNAVKCGAFDYLPKPISNKLLLEKVSAAISLGKQKIDEELSKTAEVDDSVMFSYRFIREIGAGSSGSVTLIEKEGQLYALKKFRHIDSDENPILSANKFLSVIETVAGLHHPNIIKIFDYGFPNKMDRPYVLMEYVQGNSLSYYMRKKILDMKQKLDVIRQVAFAMSAIHQEEIIHKDIKPSNVLLTNDIHVTLTDFGVSSGFSSGFTESDTLRGTPIYMSPECFDSPTVSFHSDIFSLGVMAYELFTGKRPFSGKTLAPLMKSIKNHKPPAPRSINKDISPLLENIMGAMLSKKPLIRPEASEVERALSIVLSNSKEIEQVNKKFSSYSELDNWL